jgi:plastocyanin
MLSRFLAGLRDRRARSVDRLRRRARPKPHALRLLTTAALLGLAMPAAGGVSAQGAAQTWDVQVGGTDTGGVAFGGPPGGPTPNFITQAFFPNPMVIRVGDTVQWTFNSNQPPLPIFVPGPNPGELALGPGSFPQGPTGPTAAYDGTARASTGIPLTPEQMQAAYRLTFTRPGVYGYVCEIHPGMRGEVEVREAGAPLPETPEQARQRGQATLGALLAKVQEDAQALRPTHAGTVHTAVVGVSNGFGASALRFVHGDKTVNRGDTVVWTMADTFEIHTVSFTSGAAPPDVIEPRPQAAGPPLLVFPARVIAPVGGEAYTGQGYANSGLLTLGAAYALRFDAPPGAYEYLCLLHPYMRGRITVTG